MPFIDTRDLEVFEKRPGMVAIIPPDTPHAVKVLRSGKVIVTDYPLRKDF